jgi:hypothetical protein
MPIPQPNVQMPTKQDMENAFRHYKQTRPSKFEMKLYKPFDINDSSYRFDLNMSDLCNQLITISLDRANDITTGVDVCI